MDLENYLKTVKDELRARTTCFLREAENILLGEKKEGFGEGYYIGIGGKQERGESLEETLRRELKEEICIVPEKFEQVATLNFYFLANVDWNQKVYVYLCNRWEGNPCETDEIKPEWFSIRSIPFDKMWEDAIYYLPFILKGKVVDGEFLYDRNNRVVDSRLKIIEV
jgi:mutator protein MutT